MAFTQKNEDAVSPVIGVILMVSITVILAAVIAAFVFGMSGNITKTKMVSASINRPNQSMIVATYSGGQDAATLIGLNFTVNGQPAILGVTAPSGTAFVGSTPSPNNGGLVLNGDTSIPVGTSVYLMAPLTSNFIITGAFSDGTTQIILQGAL